MGEAVWHALFHAVSSFNNAGFALYSDNLMGFAADPWICLPICAAVILSGLGFLGFFRSVQTRTAGFNSVDIGLMHDETWVGMDVLMMIGGGPAGTAGGIKVTTFAVLFFILVAELRGEGAVSIFGKRLSRAVHREAITVVLIALPAGTAGTVSLMLITGQALDRALFEAVSAFGTVGLSTGITFDLPPRRRGGPRPAHVPRPHRAAHPGFRPRPAHAPRSLRIPQGKARHWLGSRSSATRPGASPRRTPWPSSASDASAPRWLSS